MANQQIPVSPPSTPLLYSSYSLIPSPSSSYASLTSSVSTKNPRPRQSKSTSNTSENVQVLVRCRPPSDMETKTDESVCWVVSPEDGLIKLDEASGPVFEYGTHNAEIYESGIQKLVRSTMEGYNGTVFAYGQTASGKTYTMVRLEASNLRIAHICPLGPPHSYRLIYNERINDLLNSQRPPVSLKIRTANGQDYVEDLTTVVVATPKQVMDHIKLGDTQRHTSETDYNGKSSRSHTILQLTIESKSKVLPMAPVQVSRLNLIDLAGSEKVATNNERRQESSFINKSLMTLGKVIIQLNDGAKHIPYRDSKLTRILSSSLSGNDRVAVICTINPAWRSKDESTNTLRFAQSVKKVRINPRINLVAPQISKERAMSELEKHMQKKTEENKVDKAAMAAAAADSSIDDMVKECEEQLSITIYKYEDELKKKQADLQQLGDRLAQSQQNLEEKSVVIEELQVAIQDYQRINDELQSQLDKYRNSFAEVNKRWNGLESSINDYKERLIVSEGKVAILEAQRQADDHTKKLLEQQLDDYKTELERKLQEDQLLGMVQSIRDEADDASDTNDDRLEDLDRPIDHETQDKLDQQRLLVVDLEKQLFDIKIESEQQMQNHKNELEKERERSSIYRKKIDQVQDKLYEVEAALKQAKLDEVEHALKQAKLNQADDTGSSSPPPPPPPTLSTTTLPPLTSSAGASSTATPTFSPGHLVVRYLHLGQGAWVLLLAFGIWLFL
ncbi:hypothetical protein [Absidia glauca]|uniref:Kinesin-like protein n=1 Tax=Absidia glauca TaxID=4829 RepID=A0A168PB40_ABSGL|nr:hypothetical protein [Absidia glauca]